MTYNALRIVSTGIIYRLSNGLEWVELAKNARFFSMKDQAETLAVRYVFEKFCLILNAKEPSI